MPSFQPLYEGVLSWFPISFSTRCCSSPWYGCASCSIGRGPAAVPLLPQYHLSPHPHGPSAAVSRNPLWASPPSHTATPVSPPVPPAHTPLQPHPRASS